jgi:hypothetical protein
MASNDCTKSGARLWAGVACIVVLVLLLELIQLIVELGVEPDLVRTLFPIVGVASLGTLLGLSLLHQGLTNGGFLMPMRVTLVVIGCVVTLACLLGGVLQFGALSGMAWR